MEGRSVSHYEIREKLGEGGMGVVYKATDTRLDRDVALKFLPAHLLGDEEVRKRFEREAKAAAALHHTNICPVHEIDQIDGQSFIAMALIEGDSLDKKIAEGPLKLGEALAIAEQIATGLDAAHEKGVVHRDVKPENVIVDAKGHVTIMDFGLAQLTQASRLTKAGTTMGTIAYMSPEQCEGSGTDHRTDVWSLGVVLYEMVVGERPFKGDYDKAIMYSILNEDAEPMTALRTGVPMELEVAVNKAIAKSPDERYQSTSELLVDIKGLQKRLQSGQSRVVSAAPSVGARQHVVPSNRLPWVLLAVVSAIALALAFVPTDGPAPDRPVRRFSFTPESLNHVAGGRAAISPDGRQIVYLSNESPPALWVRAIDKEIPRRLEGTDGSHRRMFWSPDSRTIGFAAEGHLKKIDLLGGAPVVLCDLIRPTGYGGAAWSSDGKKIVFSSGPTFPVLHEVSANGGRSTPLLEPIASEKGRGNSHPFFLPTEDGSSTLLLTVGLPTDSDVYLWNLDSRVSKRIIEGREATYAAPGFIIYKPQERIPSVWALPFSLARLEEVGEPFPVGQHIRDAGVANDGSLMTVDVTSGATKQRLVWRDRTGSDVGEIGAVHDQIFSPSLSPDERLVAYSAQDDAQNKLWIHELAQGVSRPLTFEAGTTSLLTWSPDLSLVSYSQLLDGKRSLYIGDADGDPQHRTLVTPGGFDSEWSPDSRYLIYSVSREVSEFDLEIFDRQAGNGIGTTFLGSDSTETNAQISADGKYVAYCSDETGSRELYVSRFPSGTGRRQVSSNGGCQPRWSQDGTELFYVEGDWLVAAGVGTDAEFRLGPVEYLFSDPMLLGSTPDYDVSSDGRFVMIEEVVDETAPQRKPAIHITENWYEEFRDSVQE